MKSHLLILLICFTAVRSYAQVRVRFMNDSIDQKALNINYPPAVAPREQATSRAMNFQKLTGDYWQDFRLFLNRKGFRPDTSTALFADGYFRPDGRADLVLLRYPTGRRMKGDSAVVLMKEQPRLNAVSEQKLIRLLTEYLTLRPLPVPPSSVTTPFRLETYLNLASPSARKTLRGPGLISDLVSAAATTRPDTVKRLAFGGLQLGQVPDVIYRFTNVEEIGLSGNYLTVLPARLTTLPRLQKLDLVGNRLREDSLFFTRNRHLKAITLQGNALATIPRSLGRNRRLESLWLGNNGLQALDGRGFKRLSRVSDLNLYNAQITGLPKQIAKLRRLHVLDLYYNNLTSLPKQLGRLRRLQQLAVSHNKLRELPASVGNLKELQKLFVHHNELSQLPATMTKLTSLGVLDIGYNWFSVVPAVLPVLSSLEELDMSNNNLQELPASLARLTRLKKLFLRQNPFLRNQAQVSASAQLIDQLEANRTEVFH